MRRPMKQKVRSRRTRKPTRAADPAKRHVATEAIDWSQALRSINLEHIERLSGVEQLPPIKVWEFVPGHFRGIDGFHRWSVAKDRGDKNVEVMIRHFPSGKQGEKAFDFECVHSNIQHGLPLTREERDRAIVRIWQRWGGNHGAGETLDRLGHIFNLTKQRIHQIVRTGPPSEPPPAGVHPSNGTALVHANGSGPEPRRFRASGRFSSFGRFSAATRRLSRLLADSDVLGELLTQRRSEVVVDLRQLRTRLDMLIEAGENV